MNFLTSAPTTPQPTTGDARLDAIAEHCLTLAGGDRDTALELAPSYVGGRGAARRPALARVAKAITKAKAHAAKDEQLLTTKLDERQQYADGGEPFPF
jgi:hypothetical protein